MEAKDIQPRRKALKWSQSDLGQRVGISAASAKEMISRYEKGGRNGAISADRLAQIDRVLTEEETLRREFAAFKAGRLGK